MSTLTRIDLVRYAIARIKHYEERFRVVSGTPSASQLQIEIARDAFTAAVREFAWQWHNVEAILDHSNPILRGDSHDPRKQNLSPGPEAKNLG